MYIYIYPIITGSQCIENSIRLVGELSTNQGLVVVCLGGSWGKVCDDRWDHVYEEEAKVVCRQLGFSADGDNTYSYNDLAATIISY